MDFDALILLVNALIPLAAVIVGGLVVHYSTTHLEQKQRKRNAKALAGMLAAEIESTLRHIERRQYEKHYRFYLKRFEKGLFDERPGIRGLDDKLPDIAAATIDKLGLLDPALSCDVLSWYNNLRGIKIDLLELSTKTKDVLNEECAPLLKEVTNIWLIDIKGKAPSLIKRLKQV
ncbi:MAG: hypothetical protein OXC62_09205 [Aestuariivita sp.]|nr:hypothetical protein [Aestuariivita sp.]